MANDWVRMPPPGQDGGAINDWTPAKKPTPPSFMENVGMSVNKTLQGVGDALPKALAAPLQQRGYLPTDQDMATLQGMGQTGGGMGGVAGDIAQLAVAGPRLIPSTLAAGVYGALQDSNSPVEGAIRGAAGNVLGQGVVRGITEAAPRVLSKMFTPTADTKALMEKNIVPTLGRGTDPNTAMGSFAGRAEDISETSRLLRGPLKSQVQQGDEALMEEAFKRVGRPVPSKDLPYTDRVSMMGSALKDEYKAIYKGVAHQKDPKFLQQLEGFSRANELDPKTAGKLSKMYDRFYTQVGKDTSMSATALADFRNQLRDAADTAAGGELRTLQNAITAVDERLTRDLGRAGRDLTGLDKAFGEWSAIKQSMKGNKTGNPMTAQQYEQGVRVNARKIGADELSPSAPGAELSRPASRTLTKGEYSGGGAADTMIAFAGAPILRAGSYITQSPQMRKLLMGDEMTKQATLEALRKYGPVKGASFLAGVLGQENMRSK